MTATLFAGKILYEMNITQCFTFKLKSINMFEYHLEDREKCSAIQDERDKLLAVINKLGIQE